MSRRLTAGAVGGTGPNTLIFGTNNITSIVPNANLVLTATGTGRITTAQSVTFTANVGSTSTTTGTLVVTGGTGISENLNVGGSANVTGTLGSGNITVSNTGTLGVGTLVTPTFKFEVHHNGEWPIAARTSNSTIGHRPTFLSIRSLGSKSAPTGVTSGTNLGGMSIGGYDSSGIWRVGFDGGAEIMAFASEAWTSTAHGTTLSFLTTTTGQPAPLERARFDGNGHFVPGLNNTYDLGTSALRWRNIFTQDLHLSNGIGDYTVIEGEENLYIVNNKNGKHYKFALIEVDPNEVPPKNETS